MPRGTGPPPGVDRVELSDDSDIEVHPNVDKKSFIRAKQAQIHAERAQHQAQFEILQPQDAAADQSQSLEEAMARMLNHVEQGLDGKELDEEDLRLYYLVQFNTRLREVEEYNKGIKTTIDEMERAKASKITSESYQTGVNSSGLNKPASKDDSASKKTVELLNPKNDERSLHTSPEAVAFAKLPCNRLEAMAAIIISSPHILQDKDIDGLLIIAYDRLLEGNDKVAALQYVRQATVLQYARSRTIKQKKAFDQSVQERFERICGVAAAASEAGEKSKEVIQLQLEGEAGINVPEEGSTEEETKRKRNIFDSFPQDLKQALLNESIDEVNDAVGKLEIAGAERMVGLLGASGCLDIEPQILDMTKDDGGA
ncbi:hypothetical protein NLG97_g670 [Lecanicillium saksenae]|uniref:Uncharacterized protein n=1 Tax=Lecanicillium saksenae TaxID=468837 RepID=A0ACC1R6J4_9HYPO|nr:hypothetical protein NLG97_g670 [Lecanicillium saksenae]